MPLVEELQVYLIDDHRYGDMVGASDRMKEVYGLIDKIAPSELSAGFKARQARARNWQRVIHQFSRRQKGPLVIFDCSAFPENLWSRSSLGMRRAPSRVQ